MVFEELHKQIAAKATKEVTVIGISGMPGSGKTTLNNALGEHFRKEGYTVINWEADIYSTTSRDHRNKVMQEVREKKEKNQPVGDWPKEAYKYNFNLLRKHIQQLQNKESFSAENLCNPQTKNLDLKLHVTFSDIIKITKEAEETEEQEHPQGKIIIFIDSSLLGTPELKDLFDMIIYLQASFETRFSRVAKRGRELKRPIIVQEDFFREVEESQTKEFNITPEYAHIIIDNENPENRKIILLREA